MKNVSEIQIIITRMAELLRIGGFSSWGCTLEKFHAEILNEPNETAAKILSLYGGMGSLNDLIVCLDGIPLISENNELDILRLTLFQQCQTLRQINNRTN